MADERLTVAFDEVATGLVSPEGPLALADGSVMVVETLAGRVTTVRPDRTRRVVAQPGGGPNALAIGPDGRCYLCNNGGLTAEDIEWLRIDDPATGVRVLRRLRRPSGRRTAETDERRGSQP